MGFRVRAQPCLPRSGAHERQDDPRSDPQWFGRPWARELPIRSDPSRSCDAAGRGQSLEVADLDRSFAHCRSRGGAVLWLAMADDAGAAVAVWQVLLLLAWGVVR